MKAKIARRNYKMSDGTLTQASDNLIISGTRDLTEFADYGWDTARLDAITALRDEFSDLPTDEELMGYMVIATNDKNTKADTMRVKIRELRGRVENKYGAGSVQTVPYGWELLSRMDDNDLVRCGRRVHRVASGDSANLASEGVNPIVMAALETAANELDTAIDEQITKIKERDVAVTTRINKGNQLYGELVKLANTGKTYWESRDESKYNDYILNESTTSTQVVSGTAAPVAVVNVSVVIDQANDQVQVTNENTGTDVDLQVYFATLPTDEPNGFEQTVGSGQTLVFEAGIIGFDSADRTRLNIYNGNGEAVAYRVEVLD